MQTKLLGRLARNVSMDTKSRPWRGEIVAAWSVGNGAYVALLRDDGCVLESSIGALQILPDETTGPYR